MNPRRMRTGVARDGRLSVSPRIPAGVSIWLRTLMVLAVYALAICLVHAYLLRGIVRMPALSIALAFTIVQTAAIVVILSGLLAAKAFGIARERAAQQWIPVVRERMIGHLMGQDARAALLELAGSVPHAVERCAEDLLASISGTELVTLSDLVDELGLIERWKRRARRGPVEARRHAIAVLGRLSGSRVDSALQEALDDPEDSIRLEAARALLRSDGMNEVERIFEFATLETPFLRAILVEDLRPHAIALSEQAIPRMLTSGRSEQARIALEMVEAWQKTLPVPGLTALLRHPRPDVRAQAVRVLPYVSAEVDPIREARLALEDENVAVRIAATRVAGRMGMQSAVPELGQQLRHPDREVAVAAAYALAELGTEGWSVLEAAVRTDDSTAALASLEALERVRTDRLHLARV